MKSTCWHECRNVYSWSLPPQRFPLSMCSHKDIRISENAGFHCTDSHTVCISILMWNLWLVPKEHPIAPWWKKSSKRSEILRFFVLLPCHSDFLSVCFATLKISEISDMAKSWATFVAQSLIKTIKVYCCGNKVHNSIFIEGNTSVRLWRCGLKGIALVSIGSFIPSRHCYDECNFNIINHSCGSTIVRGFLMRMVVAE